MIVSAMLFIHATDDGARGESEMKASLAEVFTLTVASVRALEVHQTSQRCDEEGLQRCVSLSGLFDLRKKAICLQYH